MPGIQSAEFGLINFRVKRRGSCLAGATSQLPSGRSERLSVYGDGGFIYVTPSQLDAGSEMQIAQREALLGTHPESCLAEAASGEA